MAKVNLVEKTKQLGLDEIIKFQLVTHCYLEKISVSEADLNCMSLLGTLGEADLSEFCTLIANKGIFKTTQTVRNCLVRMEKCGIIVKDGPAKKRIIKLNPGNKIQTTGNIMLFYKFIYIGTTQS